MGDGLRVVFDPAIDAGGWPGVLGARAAAAGEVWLGPMGLLGRLETELGLGGVWATRAERACELAAQLAGRNGWWRESLEADPVGTCERLLRDRDALAMWGWRGEAVSERLAGLWEATRGAAPGTRPPGTRPHGWRRPGRWRGHAVPSVPPLRSHAAVPPDLARWLRRA